MTIGGKSLREHFEVFNHRDAIGYVENLVNSDEPVSPFHVRQIHHFVLAKIDDASAGCYRTSQVLIAGAAQIPLEAWKLPQLMDEWGQWLSEHRGMHPVELSALAHHRLMAIHPFVDGNGRTERLIMNLILLRAGYPPAVILKINRRQYYAVLSEADRGKPERLANFVGRTVVAGLSLYLDACENQSSPLQVNEKWIPLRQAAEGTGYSQEYLSLLARIGRIDAVKKVIHGSQQGRLCSSI